MQVFVPAYYYAQQGADPTIDHPGTTFGGWNETQVPFETDKTAIVVMHVWDAPPTAALLQHIEYIPRANAIIERRFPSFIRAARASSVRVIHVAAGFESVLKSYPGYQRMLEKYPLIPQPAIEPSKELLALRDLHYRLTGADTQEKYDELEAGYENYTFAIEPLDEEDVVCAPHQLFGLCRDHGIEHLIYTGFAVNACLSLSPCGLLDMSRCGVMCSVVGDLTTGVENKETCVAQSNRDYGLWQFAVQSGFVLLSEALKNTLLAN
ncbi:MAG: hypothetical protein IJO88_08495 [Oscillospiraceae bacterium]|nr:hypothetical protein [Oscillospiraceae bacterium]